MCVRVCVCTGEKMEKSSSWVCTVIVQLTLCSLLYIALNIGQPQIPIHRHGTKRVTYDFHFISVRGGFRPLKQQIHLLKQIEKVTKAYKVGFVVNISELGEDDPLLNNATRNLKAIKVPWYTTRALKGQSADYFVKKVKISHGKTLAVVALNTWSLQDGYDANGNIQLQWLSRTLEASSSNWNVVVGFHPLLNYDQNSRCPQEKIKEAKQKLHSLDHILTKYGVDAYLSVRPCVNNDVSPKSLPLITSNSNSIVEGPYFTPINQESLPPHGELIDGFLLHRVSPLEIVTYGVTFEGDIVDKFSVQQQGRDVM